MDRSYKGRLHNLSQLHENEHHKAPRERGWGQVGSHPHVTATVEPKDLLPPRCQPGGIRFNQIHQNLHGRIRKPSRTLTAFQKSESQLPEVKTGSMLNCLCPQSLAWGGWGEVLVKAEPPNLSLVTWGGAASGVAGASVDCPSRRSEGTSEQPPPPPRCIYLPLITISSEGEKNKKKSTGKGAKRGDNVTAQQRMALGRAEGAQHLAQPHGSRHDTSQWG